MDRLVQEHEVEVEWKAFELRPEGMQLPEKSPEYMARAKAGVEALSHQYGIEMKWNDKSKHSRMALAGAKYAAEQNKDNAYHDAVFSAQFQQQKNINDLDTLVEIAAGIGLDEKEFRQAAVSEHYQERVVKESKQAQQMGVTGIPCFVIRGKGVMGVQSYEDLLALVQGQK